MWDEEETNPSLMLPSAAQVEYDNEVANEFATEAITRPDVTPATASSGNLLIV
jgi:hypothetical protein